mmetsp:Transcript_74155/g.188148  ORF Transcript_74155/g.188148 Transcript_74155/m.188148 type:complete len:352 (+) Transcript_74155:87-1142(+)|eukprot:CAMPEP_0183393778 /NCGR_PEP_ID=MMETSP0370-20130417/8135_1 /TAXON_ID=268820 /ORGANISM="Peridinium aciculiferum, Strain PAER-2" /LENGTH=351 /DNA_ID=CAMNT_0025574039 /DNA_START=88 /DNA_END=1143 /DNA_ORIENTATION=+
MAKGEYEFPILVVCLLILALQIHNPFQSNRQGVCQCNGDASGRLVEQASTRGSAGASGRQQQEPQPPPVYRRPQAPGAGGAGGLSTDELLRELDSIQVKAKEQQDTLTAAGRMPAASPILQQIKESEAAAPPGQQARPRAVPQQAPQLPPQVPPAVPSAGAAAGAAQLPLMLRRRDDFGRFLQARQPRGLGVVLGVGRGEFALRLLSEWSAAQGVYLVDPFIHIWRGYDDPANLQDREHQMIFEDLRNRLVSFEGRYVLVRDFSHSFAETYHRGGQTSGPPTFVYLDANPAEEAVSRDIELWWQLLASGGILAGGSYSSVRTSVDRFGARHGQQVYLTHDDTPQSWFLLKP